MVCHLFDSMPVNKLFSNNIQTFSFYKIYLELSSALRGHVCWDLKKRQKRESGVSDWLHIDTPARRK